MCYIDLTNLYKAKIQTANCLLGIFCRGFAALFLYKEIGNIFLWRHEPRKSIHLARFIYQRAFCRSSTIVILLQRLVEFVLKNSSFLFPVPSLSNRFRSSPLTFELDKKSSIKLANNNRYKLLSILCCFILIRPYKPSFMQ